jgi:hypothetical protein
MVLDRKAIFRALRACTVCAALGVTIVMPPSPPRHRIVDRLDLPRVMLWAWERPEQLDDLGSRRTGVAFLARTFQLSGDAIVTRPRLNPLHVTPGTPMMAVARIETDRVRRPRFSSARTAWLADELAKLAALPEVRAVQIDFDAAVSERAFYRDLIVATRAALGARTPLSITALASWCMGDPWIADLPIDEAVPMLFRMGDGEDRRFRGAGASNTWRVPQCRTSVGISTDEPIVLPRDARRVYVFHPAAWTPRAVTAALLNK